MFEKLRNYRKYLNIPIKRAAIDSGLSVGLISEAENGVSPKRQSQVKALEKYYKKLEKTVKSEVVGVI